MTLYHAQCNRCGVTLGGLHPRSTVDDRSCAECVAHEQDPAFRAYIQQVMDATPGRIAKTSQQQAPESFAQRAKGRATQQTSGLHLVTPDEEF